MPGRSLTISTQTELSPSAVRGMDPDFITPNSIMYRSDLRERKTHNDPRPNRTVAPYSGIRAPHRSLNLCHQDRRGLGLTISLSVDRR
jgi:hypothetical protein